MGFRYDLCSNKAVRTWRLRAAILSRSAGGKTPGIRGFGPRSGLLGRGPFGARPQGPLQGQVAVGQHDQGHMAMKARPQPTCNGTDLALSSDRAALSNDGANHDGLGVCKHYEVF